MKVKLDARIKELNMFVQLTQNKCCVKTNVHTAGTNSHRHTSDPCIGSLCEKRVAHLIVCFNSFNNLRASIRVFRCPDTFGYMIVTRWSIRRPDSRLPCR